MVFQFGTCGTASRDPKYQPDTYLAQPTAQQLIYDLCHQPVAVEAVDKASLDGLLLVGAVRVSDSRCYLNCTCFLRDDIAVLNESGSILGESLARAVQSALSVSPLRSLRFVTREEDLPRYLFFLVGCVALDWRGLALLAQRRYTLQPSETSHEGGGNYTIFMNERFERSLHALYWGSHNWTWGDYTFTSFGDHESRRECLPDLAWRMRSVPLTQETSACLAACEESLRSYAISVARHLMSEQEGDHVLQAHLDALHYTRDGRPAVPIIVPEDMATLRPWLGELDRALLRWIEGNNDEIRGSLGSLTPLRQGVGWREVLLQVWHYIFAHANRHLCARGTLLDPYSADSAFPGYLPAVFRRQCSLREVLAD